LFCRFAPNRPTIFSPPGFNLLLWQSARRVIGLAANPSALIVLSLRSKPPDTFSPLGFNLLLWQSARRVIGLAANPSFPQQQRGFFDIAAARSCMKSR
jgi:hypothetical protein